MTTSSVASLEFLKGIIIYLLFTVVSSHAQLAPERPPSPEEREHELLDFQSIRSILESDQLQENVEHREIQVTKQQTRRIEHNKALYNVPTPQDFWSFFSEYWLVKNAPVLRWDFQKPDYGIAPAFQEFLEKMGIYEQGFKILLINSPSVPHFALPSDPRGDVIFILSVPFIRTLDLSKQEISLLLFENLLRHRQNYFQNMAKLPELEALLGSNFQGGSLNMEVLNKLSKKYDNIIFDSGFQFQQQFEVTRLMDQHLKNDLQLWNVYYNMIRKIDELVKRNTLYQRYNIIYPSTELQLNWLRPRQSSF